MRQSHPHTGSHADKKIVIYILNKQYILQPTIKKLSSFKQIPQNNILVNTKITDEELGKAVRKAFENCEAE